MTPELRRLNAKRERLMLKRAQLPPSEQFVALDAEIKATAEMIARRVAVAQRATEPAVGPVACEWVPTPNEPARLRSSIFAAAGRSMITCVSATVAWPAGRRTRRDV
jgi:hypothetical protein